MPQFKISIYGLGLIGASIAKAIKASEFPAIISGYDKPDVAKKAFEDGYIDKILLDLNSYDDSDLIFLCLPLENTISVLKLIGPKLKENQIITDVSGVKNILHETWESFNSRGIFIGGHPMTGKEKGGYENSDPLLFENSVYILTTKNINTDLNKLADVIQILGARITVLNPQVHDKIIAYVSHLPQLLSVALVNSAAKDFDGINSLDFAAGGFRDMTRIASSDFKIWESVIKFNRFEILNALDKASIEIKSIKKMITEFNLSELDKKFESSRKSRDEIPKNTKGFLNPLHDLFVFVKDEPGVVSKISTTLFKNNINIKDIELLKIREGTGGTFRLSFDSETDVIEAEKLLKSIGFSIR